MKKNQKKLRKHKKTHGTVGETIFGNRHKGPTYHIFGEAISGRSAHIFNETENGKGGGLAH